MSFFRRNKDSPQIPLPGPRDAPQPNVLTRGGSDRSGSGSTGGPPSYRSGASTYVQSRDGLDPYSQPQRGPSPYGGRGPSPQPPPPAEDRDRYARGAGIGDPYSRAGAGSVEADRAQLFGGYNPESRPQQGGPGGRSRFEDGPTGGGSGRWREGAEPVNQEEEDEYIKDIQSDMRKTKQDSLASTRNALRLAREAEETGRATLLKLGDQSEKLANTEQLLDKSKSHTSRAEDRTKEIKQLNKSIFNPVLVWDKEGKRRKEEDRISARHAAEQDERERAMGDVRESHNRIGRAATYGMGEEDSYGAESSMGGYGRKGNLTKGQMDQRKAGRSRFQFDATASDDEVEDELDDNLDEIHDVTKRLKALASAQGDELSRQNERLGRMTESATRLDDKLVRATDRLKKL